MEWSIKTEKRREQNREQKRGGEDSSCGARKRRDRMDNYTFFTSFIFKIMYNIVSSHHILSHNILSQSVLPNFTLSYFVWNSLNWFWLHRYLFIYFFIYFLPVRAWHNHTKIQLCVCECLCHALPPILYRFVLFHFIFHYQSPLNFIFL